MADNNVIDSLELKVKGDANSAISNLEKLQTKLRQTAGSVKNLRTAVTALSSVDLSFKNLNGVNVNKLSKAIDQLERLDKLKLDKLNGKSLELNFKLDTSSTEKVAEQLKESFSSLKDLGGIDLKTNGTSSFIASMSRLSKVDFKGFDKESLGEIVNSVKEIADIKNIETGVTRLVSALARLASAGENTRLAANALPILGDNLKNLVGKIKGSSGGLPSELVTFTSAIGQLANAGNKTLVTAENLKALGEAVATFIADVQGAPEVSDSIVRMTEAIGQMASSGSKAGTAARTVGKSITDMSEKSSKAYARMQGLVGIMRDIYNIFSKAGNAVKQGALKIINSLRNIRKESNGLQTATQSIKSMIAAMIGFRGITGLGNVLKETVMLGANITEIDHIVESVFGNMSGVVDAWANDAIKNFGIASGAAKQYAGVLSSMFQSSNIGYMDAGKMSLDLVELAGDLSAFYNIDTETAFNKIRSGMAGMVRPLRDLGIDLTAATLEEFRLAQGIETAYSQMTQSEKVMLRYQYLMANTTTQQGDFQRTNLSLANSLRTLQGYVQAVQTQLGVGLASAIRHVVVLLNTLMQYVLKAATVFASFMQTIFGKYKGGASGVAIEGLGDAADYADDLGDAAGGAASGLSDAADSAKQLKKDLSVLPFDELNQLNKDRESADSGGGSGSGVGSGVGGGGITDGLLDWGDLAEDALEGSALRAKLNAWATQLKKDFLMHDWEGLGRDFADGLNRGLQKLYDVLDPSKVAEKVDPWINAFTTTFNSFIDHFDFNLLGKDMGRGINIIVHEMNEVIEGINFHNLGSRIADGLNGLLDEVNFEEFGQLIGNKLMIIWDVLNGFVHRFSWDNLGVEIGNTINGLFGRVNLSTIADTLATGLNGLFETIKQTSLTIKWEEIAQNIIDGVNTFISEFQWSENGADLNHFLTNLVDTLVSILGDIDWEGLGEGIADFLSEIEWAKHLKKVAGAIVKALGELLKGLFSEPEGVFAGFIIAGIGALTFKESVFGSFAGNLVKAITGKTVGDIVRAGFSKLFEKKIVEASTDGAVTAAAETAWKNLVGSFKGGLSGLGTVAAEFGIVTLAVGGTVAAIYGLTRWVDKLQGGNGKITESGEALEAYIERIGESGQLSSQQVDMLWKEIEDMETAGYNTADMIEHVRGRLDEWKVSTDAQYGALQTLNSENTTSKNIIDEMAQSYAATGDASAQYSADVGVAFEAVKQALYDARDATGDYSGRYDEVVRQLTESQGTFYTTQDVINATSAIMESVGLSTDALGEDFDELANKAEQDAQRVNTATETMRSGISIGFEGAEGAVNKYVVSAAEKVSQNVHDLATAGSAASTYDSNVSKSMSNTEKSVADYQSKAHSNLASNESDFNSMSTGSVASMVKMGLQTAVLLGLSAIMSTGMSNNAKKVSESFKTMGDDVKTAMSNIGEGLKSGLSGFEDAVKSSMTAVHRILLSQNLELWRQGEAMGQSLAKGFSSVYIPSPHLYVAYYTMVTNSDGSWYSYPNWGVSWYRSGGLFKGGNGQLVGIAEDGRDEAVLPLEDRRAMSRIGSAIAEAGGSSGMSDDVVDKLATRIAEIVMASQGNNEQPMNYIELKVDDEVLARAVTTGQQKLDYRNNPTPQMA